MAKMTADHRSSAVGNGDVQVGAIGRERAGQAEDLQIATDRGGLSRPREAQLGQRQAADATDYTARLLLLLVHPGLQCPAQIVSGLEPQRHHLHGPGPSTSC